MGYYKAYVFKNGNYNRKYMYVSKIKAQYNLLSAWKYELLWLINNC